MNRRIPAVMVPPATEEWRLDAACQGDAELFFPPDDGRGWKPDAAVAVCRLCPVRMACLRTALAREGGDHTTHGVWGGLTANQRTQLRRCLAGQCTHEDPAICMEAIR